MSPSLDDARAVLSRYFGYADFRSPQLPAIRAALSRRDALIVLPTGGGKSICFQVPALCFPRLTVVVSPLISLMADQVQALERRGIGATFLNSTLQPDETAQRVARIRSGDVRLLYVAPERLAVGSTAGLLADVGVDLLAVDEAHCVSEWGQDFRPSYLRLATVRRELGDPQTIALTATATPAVRRDVARLLALRDPEIVVGGFDRPNLTFRVQRVPDEPARNQAMLRHLQAISDPAVVYAATRRQVEQVTKILSAGKVNAVAYHAGLAAERRAAAQDSWMEGRARVIVATNAFGMGIDKPDVRLVLHYIHSGSLEDYYQEAGRAGRDGARSRCVLLFNRADRGIHDRMRAAGHVPATVLRGVWTYLTRSSFGRRDVPLDPKSLARNAGPDATPEGVARAIQLLQDRDVLPASRRADSIRLRVIASPLRLECERGALGAAAALILDRAGAAGDWSVVPASDLGLPPHRIDEALEELESNQLAYVDRQPALIRVAPTAEGRRGLERAISQLKNRREAERVKLDSMVGYATTSMCRRKYVLGYFGDRSTEAGGCGDCDVCAPGR